MKPTIGVSLIGLNVMAMMTAGMGVMRNQNNVLSVILQVINELIIINTVRLLTPLRLVHVKLKLGLLIAMLTLKVLNF